MRTITVYVTDKDTGLTYKAFSRQYRADEVLKHFFGLLEAYAAYEKVLGCFHIEIE